ncbi:MAG TPA: ATP-binding cassette domain-containing protein, partial [Stellaceae bacterium]|nr:ATP-binding cassette domain-containing protein [Stellaceae bacterium]
FALFPILAERAQQLGGTLSGGQQQMLAIAMALMHDPRLMILDEPSIGLAPNLVDRVMQAVREVNQRFATTVLMVEQNVRYSLPIADRVAVLKTGLKIYDGPPDPLHDRVELMKLF